jgi:hypothetical protein
MFAGVLIEVEIVKLSGKVINKPHRLLIPIGLSPIFQAHNSSWKFSDGMTNGRATSNA